jgi:hypothetical protein
MTIRTPNYQNPLFWRDLGERVFWTLAEAFLALIPWATLDLPAWSIPVVAAVVASVKGFVAKQISRKGTASTAPGV